FKLPPSAVAFPAQNGRSVACKIAQVFDGETALVSALPWMEFENEMVERWNRALEGTVAGYWDLDVLSNVYWFSKQYYRMLGYEPNEFPASRESWQMLLHPDDAVESSAFYALYVPSRETTFQREFRMRAKDGSYRWVMSVGASTRDENGKILRMTGWNFDVTEKVEALEKLKISEERSRNLLDALPDLIMSIDRDGIYREVHAHNWPVLVVPPHEMIGKSIHDLLPKPVADKRLVAIRAAIESGQVTTTVDEMDVRGTHIDFETRITRGTGGNALIVVRDITVNRKAETARREVEDRLRTLSRHVPGMIFQFQSWPDKRNSFPFANDKASEILGVTAEELKERGYDGIRPPFAHKEDEPGLKAAFRESGATQTSVSWEGRVFVAAGACKWIRILATPRKEKDGSLIWNGIALDVTEEHMLRRQLQEQQAMMSASSRLAALGEMAGGIAHEINNPLTVAHAYASRLRDLAHEGRLDDRAVDVSAEKIENVCMRISRIIAGLRTLARDGAEDFMVPAKLTTLVSDALALCSEKLKHLQIELMITKVPDSLIVECRPVQISQVLVNLLSNAQHAVEGKPRARWIRVDYVEHEDEVDLRVTDSGDGVAPHLRERIFDPFFTTKEVGKGTGLGLSVSASIARSHSGKLMLDSESPHTTFVLRLPKTQPVLSEANP
ncbi:MAG: PAS domain-containing protein, partial [Bdellovibrionota bacterium]